DLISVSTVCGFFEVVPSLPLRISFVNTFVQKLADFFILGNFCKAVYRFVTKNALRTTVSNTQSVKLTC
ncbi:MAG: hypothetical protein PUH59_05840, partial [Phascolarctobacterium succinatutens]|uniref:hypothetical protein n=1 Tax=Phascolarctobacterium succinatutens TaxID=626940 RepID=UPI001CA302EA